MWVSLLNNKHLLQFFGGFFGSLAHKTTCKFAHEIFFKKKPMETSEDFQKKSSDVSFLYH